MSERARLRLKREPVPTPERERPAHHRESAGVAPESSGTSLDTATRADMEALFGHDFGRVRVHTDQQSAEAARALDARAFTVGEDIAFAPGEYSPESRDGLSLLAHELVHVVQHRMHPGAVGERVSHPADPAEQEADRIGDSIAAGAGQRSAPIQPAAAPAAAIQRQGEEDAPGTVTFAPETITVTPGSYTDRGIMSMNNALSRAEINALKFAVQVESACEAFKVYAEEKVKDLEGAITGQELVEVLINVAFIPIGGAATAKVTSALAKELVKVAVDEAKKLATERVKKEVSNSDEADALRQAINQVSMFARDGATMIMNRVSTHIKPLANNIIQKLNSGQPLTADEEDFLGNFWMAPPDIVDANLEEYGIPSQASAAEIHVRVFRDLVQQFEEKRIWATASFREKLEMGFAQDFGATELTAGYKAGQLAAAAAEERRRALESQGAASR